MSVNFTKDFAQNTELNGCSSACEFKFDELRMTSVCAHMCLLRTISDLLACFLPIARVRVGFKRLNFDATCALIICGRFMGHLAKPASTIEFGENSAQVFFFPLHCHRKRY